MRYRFAMHPTLSILAWLLLAAGVALPTLVTAQGYPLRVSLHDAGGLPLHGIVVVVRAEGGQELDRQTTDVSGTVRFADLPAVVRVAVEGQARGGPRLYQLGDDERGVRLDLGQAQGSPSLDLRVERDGLVLPDPATMLSLEDGGPIVEEELPLPTAAIATPAPLPTTSIAHETGIVSIDGRPGPTERRRADWVPAVTLLLVVAALGVLRLVQKLRGVR